MGNRTLEQQEHRDDLEEISVIRGVKSKHNKTPGGRVLAVLKYLAERNDRGLKETPAKDWYKKMYGED